MIVSFTNLKKTLLVLFLCVFIFGGSLSMVSAQGGGDDGGASGGGDDGGASEFDSVELVNPLNNITSIPDLLTAILNIIMILMVPIIVFFIIYSGFKYVTARGNASQVEEASQSLLYAIIGGLLILGAIAISEIIQNVVNAF